MKLAGELDLGPLRGQGNIGFEGVPDRPFTVGDVSNRFGDIISITIGALTIIAFIWFLFKLLTGAMGILGSGGDKAKLAEARANITYGIVGLILVISATFISALIGIILGVDFTNMLEVLTSLR